MSCEADHHLPELRHRPMVFVDDLEHPHLEAGDRHHLERSLRIKAGAPLTLCDGDGRWRPARFGAAVEVDGPVVVEPHSDVRLVVGFAPVKGDRSDMVVQKLTELGVDVIVPLRTERSVVRWDETRSARNLERHQRIAREAAMQSRNPWLPSIRPLTAFSAFLAAQPETVLADPGGEPFSSVGHRCVAIGPEGGFSATEIDGRNTVALPGRILRTETAAIAAAVLLAGGR